jgi:hypothetical protein
MMFSKLPTIWRIASSSIWLKSISANGIVGSWQVVFPHIIPGSSLFFRQNIVAFSIEFQLFQITPDY